jgi:hypothetical protein
MRTSRASRRKDAEELDRVSASNIAVKQVVSASET